MATLTGKTIANTYKDLLQVSNNNSGVDATLRTIQDGEGTNSALQISQSGVNINGNFFIGGEQLTANVSSLNNVADLTGAIGIIAVSAGSVYGRSIIVGSPLSITNADGTEGNPTINLANSGVSAGTYGPMTTMTVDTYGRITDVTATTTVSADAFIGGTLSGSSLYVENNVSVSGTLEVAGTTNLKAVSATDIVANTISATSNIYSPIVSTTGLHAVSASIGTLYAANLTFANVSTNTFTANQLTIVSAATLAGVSVATINDIASLSATMATSINNTNANVTTNINAITSINSVVTNLSATMATSIDNTNTNVTNNTTNINTNIAAITSINNVITNLSSTMATSIDNSNTLIAAVSALTSVNAESITSINSVITSVNNYIASVSSTLATSISNHLPLSGGTMTGTLTLAGAPATNLEAATKQYVDNLTAAAIHFHDAVRVESPNTAGNLNATYNNGASGVGATLTNAGTQAALVIDGVTLNTSDRVLIYNQTNAYENGIYTVTDTGSPSTNWVLTRATDADSYSPSDNTGIDGGSYFYVQEGDDGAGEAYVCNNVGTITIGTTAITFVQFSSALVYTAGTGIDINSSRIISTSGVATDAALTALSATMATSIDNTNTNLTALSATVATSIANHLPLAGGTLTGHVSGTSITMSGNVSANSYYGDGSNLTGVGSEGFAIAIAIALG